VIPPPIALGLTICDLVIVEEGTKKVSLVGAISTFQPAHFPFLPAPFFVHVALTDGLGNATIDLIVTHLDTGESIYFRQRAVRFSHKLNELHVAFRISDCSFPSPGLYQVTLLLDREWVAHQRFRILAQEV
jgi:hypothetical protein